MKQLVFTILTFGCANTDTVDHGTETITVSMEFRNDKQIINTDRGRLVVLPDAECLEVEELLLQSSSPGSADVGQTSFDEDESVCAFLDAREVPVWEGEQTVAFWGYVQGAPDLSLYSCFKASAQSLTLHPAAQDGFETQPLRCPTVTSRCDGSCKPEPDTQE